MIRVFNPIDIQKAVENLLVDHQDKSTVNIVLRSIPAPDDHYNEIKLVRPDHDKIQVGGPIIDHGNGKFTCFATIQVEIEVKRED